VNETTLNIEAALTTVKSQITRFEDQYERQTGSTQLLAVSKKKPASSIRVAIAAGHKNFGENYVEEGVAKIREIDDSTLIWHFIGAIQSRKTGLVSEHFHWAHGVDRLKIARRLSDQRPAHLPELNICLQVNLDNEESKAGLPIEEVAPLAAECASLDHIRLRGLMAIPAPREALAEQRKVFARLRSLLSQLQVEHPAMDTLSMGMSADIEAAIAEGATIVRVGTAIFGARDI